MSTELERQLRAGFGRLPKPTREASAPARAAALYALGPHRPRSRRGPPPLSFARSFVIGARAAAPAAPGDPHRPRPAGAGVAARGRAPTLARSPARPPRGGRLSSPGAGPGAPGRPPAAAAAPPARWPTTGGPLSSP